MFPHTGAAWQELVWVFRTDQRELRVESHLLQHTLDLWDFMVHSAPHADVREDQHMEQGTCKNNTGITSTATEQKHTL